MSKFIIVRGTTAAQEFQLFAGGDPIDLSGITVSLVLNDASGTAVTTSGKVAVSDEDEGKVTFTSNGTDLTVANGPYYARWKLVDGTGAISYVPSTNRDEWDVVAE